MTEAIFVIETCVSLLQFRKHEVKNKIELSGDKKSKKKLLHISRKYFKVVKVKKKQLSKVRFNN